MRFARRACSGALAAIALAGTPALAAEVERPAWAQLAVVTEIKTWSFANYTRVVVYFDRQIRWEEKNLPANAAAGLPPRIYLDLLDTRLAPSVPAELPIGDGLLKRARIAQFDKTRARLVLDLESLAASQVVPFRDPFRLVIDVRGQGAGTAPPATAAPVAPVPTKSAAPVGGIEDILGGHAPAVAKAPPPKSAPPVIRNPPRTPVVVIDAGHGGKDPGAIGVKGIREKDVVLKVALGVGKRLQKTGYKVVYTRNDDHFLKLEERTIVANRENADLFVSIHANSAPDPKAYGVETYRLAKASDKRAAEVAARENATTYSSDGDVLDELILALKMTTKQNLSGPLAQYVQSSIVQTLSRQWEPFRSIGVKGAPFYVLVGTEMPAILIEVGFVTNPVEAQRMRSEKYLGQMADAIATGVEKFFRTVNREPI